MATANTTQPLSPFLNAAFARTTTSQNSPSTPNPVPTSNFQNFNLNSLFSPATSSSPYAMSPLMQQFMKSVQYGASPSGVHESESRASSTSMSMNPASPGAAAKSQFLHF
ncbi:unnamed protein product [Bursaphelenchus okinawaensis]|uniref:Uncharacterized protein n=1 Tax=Bursaphelenchus okinawaensis TaxID=465554 RepID=A0A811KB99_9BILA|nr:unnamed protein product [Bursaphelenchus okinawaensis]CAG9097093.1 unnamed protein product [Bursaphelenchus okinawaensis]